MQRGHVTQGRRVVNGDPGGAPQSADTFATRRAWMIGALDAVAQSMDRVYRRAVVQPAASERLLARSRGGTLPVMRWMLALALSLGCATGPRVGRTAYQPSSSNGSGYGYSDVRLNERMVQVTFTAVTASEAQTGALRRAADLAVQLGADGFTIVSREDGADTIVRKRFVVGRVRRNIPVTVLTVNLLKRNEFGSAPLETMVYDAHLLLQQQSSGAY